MKAQNIKKVSTYEVEKKSDLQSNALIFAKILSFFY